MTSPNTAPLRTAVIGAGAGVFHMHAPALLANSYAVVAVADVNPDAGRARAAELGCDAFTDHQALLAAVQPDVAVIITPHPFHAAITVDCLEAGSHVLVEKPIAVQAAEADAMADAAQRTGRLLTVSLQQRFRPDVRAAYELIQAGRLGKLQFANMVVTWPRTLAYFKFAGWRGTWKGEGGGVLLNQAPHNLDLLCHLMGMPARTVAWTRTTMHDIETEDTVQAMFEWEDGAVGSLHVSTAESGQPERLEILGTMGRLELSRSGLLFQEFAQDLRTYFVETDQIYRGPDVHDVAVTLPDDLTGHTAVYADLRAAIAGQKTLLTDAAEARMSLELANAMIYASHTDRPVDFPLDRAAYGELLAELQRTSKFRE